MVHLVIKGRTVRVVLVQVRSGMGRGRKTETEQDRPLKAFGNLIRILGGEVVRIRRGNSKKLPNWSNQIIQVNRA